MTILDNITEYVELLNNIDDINNVNIEDLIIIMQEKNVFEINKEEDISNFDEPTNHLDLISKERIEKLLKEYIKTYNESLKIMSKEYKDLFNTHMINNFFETRKTVKGINKIKLKNSFYKLLKTQLPIKIYSNKRKCKFANKHNLLKTKLKFNILIALVSISNILRKTIKQLGKIKRNIKASDNIKTYNKYKNKPLKNQVLLVGFGWRYTGNNRYLFEELKTQNNNFDIYYAVNSKEVVVLENIPRTSAGKIDKKQVKKEYLDAKKENSNKTIKKLLIKRKK